MARERVLGLPIGKQKKPRYQVVKAAGTAAAILAPVIALPVARKMGHTVRGAEDLVDKGHEVAGKAKDVAKVASNVQESVSSHKTTIGKVGGLISAIAKGGKDGSSGQSKPKLSHLIEQHMDIAVPRSVVYNQWTQFEMFPTLVKGIESVSQEEDDKVEWTAKIGPSRRTWTGKIVEQIPDERIAWKSEGGASLQGVVTFHSIDEDLTRVLLQMEYKPSGAVEWTGNTLRIQRRRAKRDLRLFKHFIEMRGEETGAWRGRIEEDEGLEPQFSGQGKVDQDNRSGRRSRPSSTRASSRSRSQTAKRSTGTRRSNGASGNGRRASSSSGANGASRNGRRASSSSGANGASRNGRRASSSGGANGAQRNGGRATTSGSRTRSSAGRSRRTS